MPPPARILELGAAPGDQIAQLAELGYEATAVDLGVASDEWGDGPPGRMVSLLEASGVELVLWDLEETPYPLTEATFEAVIMTEVFEHLREYPTRSLCEVRRVLRPGGRLYFTTLNAAYVMNRARLLVGNSVATPLHDWIGGLPHARHAREYTFDEINELMTRAGLTVRVATSRHFHSRSGRTGPIMTMAKRAIDMMARLGRTMGPSVVVMAERPVE
ncbi:MAG: class I SAM-dependent methyltransferase [Actinomycetota bacterium]|nr:class I SAM-dependent methyltransferase [Actinomycetota bacterium]